MSNFLMGIVAGFMLCVWVLDANPVTATASLFDRLRQIEVSFAGEPQSLPRERPGTSH